MFTTFIENINTVKEYIGQGYLAGLYLFCLIYLAVAEKEKRIRWLLIYAPLIILFLFIFPPFRLLFERIGLDGEIYYRMLWLLPMGVTIAYAACRLSRTHKRIGLAVTVVTVALCGSYVYSSPHITKAENAYHIPSVTAHICDFLQAAEELEFIRAAFPAGLVPYVRQYDSNIMMPFGRDVPQWNYYNAVYEAMEATDMVDIANLVEATRAAECNYIILHTTRLLSDDPTNHQLILLATIDGFLIYKDPVMAEHISEKYGPYL
jgi:hypothetical protein